jgi:hypothetical protein
LEGKNRSEEGRWLKIPFLVHADINHEFFQEIINFVHRKKLTPGIDFRIASGWIEFLKNRFGPGISEVQAQKFHEILKGNSRY